AHILDHGLVELVSGHLDGGGLHHAGEGDDGDVGGAAADIHHHVAVGLGDVDARADGGGHRLLNEVHPAAAGLDARVHHGPLLHLGDAGGDADDDPGLEDHEARHLADELPEHPLGHVVVGDDALPQGADGDDVAGGAAQHLAGLLANLQELAGILVHGHHGWLVENDALALDVDQNGSGTQVDTDIFRERAHSFHLVFSILGKLLACTLKNHYTGPFQILQAVTITFFPHFCPNSKAKQAPAAVFWTNPGHVPSFSGGRPPARAAQTTDAAPASIRVRAQAARVLPVVTTSSTSRNRRPAASSGR